MSLPTSHKHGHNHDHDYINFNIYYPYNIYSFTIQPRQQLDTIMLITLVLCCDTYIPNKKTQSMAGSFAKGDFICISRDTICCP